MVLCLCNDGLLRGRGLTFRCRIPQEVSDRLDRLVSEIKGAIISADKNSPNSPKDVVCIAHGHILAALALRWAQQPLSNGMRLLNEPCGVAVLGFVLLLPSVLHRC